MSYDILLVRRSVLGWILSSPLPGSADSFLLFPSTTLSLHNTIATGLLSTMRVASFISPPSFPAPSPRALHGNVNFGRGVRSSCQASDVERHTHELLFELESSLWYSRVSNPTPSINIHIVHRSFTSGYFTRGVEA